MTDNGPLQCATRIERGAREGQRCGWTAIAIVVSPVDIGLLVCGVHRRTWTDRGVARIAYWNEAQETWL